MRTTHPTADHQLTEQLSQNVCWLLFSWLAAVFAAHTVLTHAAQFTGMSFQVYARTSLGFALTLTAATALRARWLVPPTRKRDGGTLLVLAGAGVLGALLALVCHRPDADDAYYLPNAVYVLQNPQASMGFAVRALYSGSQPFQSYFYATALPFEYAHAVAAHFLGIEYLSAYYRLGPAVVGFLIPAALYLAVSLFVTESRHALAGTLAALALVMLLGETHRTPGHFSFARAFQGKTLFLAIGIPLFNAAVLRYLAERSWPSWLLLVATATSLVGTSASTVVLLPPLVAALALAVWVAEWRRPALAEAWGILAALAYPIGCALFLLGHATIDVGTSSPVNVGWSVDFSGHLELLVNPRVPLTPLLFATSLLLSMWLGGARTRVLLVTWTAFLVVTCLNPWTAPILIEHVTTPNIYWRLFYLLPFPLSMGIAVGLLSERTGMLHGRARTVATACAGLALAVALGASSPTSIFQPPLRFGRAEYKLSRDHLEVARRIVEVAPPGPMLSPLDIANIVPSLSGEHPQMRVRTGEVLLWLGSRGRKKEARQRLMASEYVGGGPAGHPSFRALLKRRKIRSIVFTGVPAPAAERPEVREQLAALGFDRRRAVPPYTVVWRSQPIRAKQ